MVNRFDPTGPNPETNMELDNEFGQFVLYEAHKHEMDKLQAQLAEAEEREKVKDKFIEAFYDWRYANIQEEDHFRDEMLKAEHEMHKALSTEHDEHSKFARSYDENARRRGQYDEHDEEARHED